MPEAAAVLWGWGLSPAPTGIASFFSLFLPILQLYGLLGRSVE